MSDVTDSVESLPPGVTALSDPVFLFDPDGSLLDWNDAARTLTGYEHDELTSLPLSELFVPEDARRLVRAAERTLRGEEPTILTTLVDTDGSHRPVEFSLSSGLGGDSAVVGVGRERPDVAASRQLKQREQALSRAYEVITTADPSLESTVDRLLDVVRETLGTEYATLSRVRDGEYHIEAVVGPDGTGTVDVGDGQTVEEGDTLPLDATNCERVVETEGTMAFGDIDREAPELAERPVNAQFGITAYLGAPVMVEGQPYGTFCFYDMDSRMEGFSEWEVTFVELLSNWVSNQLEREQLMEQRRDRELQSLLEHSSDRLSVLDEDGNYKFASPAADRLRGYDTDELLGTSELEYVHPEDRDIVKSTLERILDDPGETYTFEYRIEDAEGNWRWIEARATNKVDDSTIEGIVINSRDITERKEREQKIEEERAFTESILQTLPDVLYAFDANGNFLRWNDQLSTVTGYDDDEIASMRPSDFVAQEDRADVAEAIASVFNEDTTVTVEADFVTKDGEYVPYEFTGAKMTSRDGETLGLVGIGRDISDRKERQRRFEAVFNNTYQFTGLMAPDGTLLEANDTALEFGGLDRADVVGTEIWNVHWFQTDETAREIAREAVETARNGEFYRNEVTVQGETGTEIIDFSVRPVVDDDGDVSLLIPEGRKITALKRREQHLGVLHRFLRHNLRNKMTVITGTAELLAEEVTDPTLQQHVTQVRGAARELLQLSETANELSRAVIEADSDLRPVDLDAVLDRVLDDFGDRYPEARIDAPQETGREVLADWRLDNVFEQLVENALEHSDCDSPIADIDVEIRGDRVAVSITDYGPGIPENELAGIVNDEERTQLTHGSGFGLWLVRSVVDEYGGSLSYEPAADGGSIFTIELPTVDS